MILILLFISACFLAYSNDVNDNFKGEATLFGRGTTNYKKAINWATVSTTHVSVGSIFGIGTATKKSDYKMIGKLLLSWLLTLPIAAIISALLFKVLKTI